MTVHNHGIDPSCKERIVGECLLEPGSVVITDWCPSGANREALLKLLRDHYWTHLADQIEAQTKPPRIPEPGLWGVVRASKGGNPAEEWVHTQHGWSNGYYVHPWKALDNPVLVRKGVEG